MCACHKFLKGLEMEPKRIFANKEQEKIVYTNGNERGGVK